MMEQLKITRGCVRLCRIHPTLNQGANNLVSSFLEKLFKEREAPILPFNIKKDKSVLRLCMQFNEPSVRNKVLRDIGSKSGIYLLGLKDDPRVYYIGKTSNFRVRLYTHSQAKSHTKVHKLLKLAGLNRFYSAIL